MSAEQILIIAMVVILLVFAGMFLWLFFSLGNLWLRAFLCGAKVSLIHLLAMKLRRSPSGEIVDAICMARQCGIDVSPQQIESAVIQGVDVKRSILTLKHAKEKDIPLTWEETLSEDTRQRIAGE